MALDEQIRTAIEAATAQLTGRLQERLQSLATELAETASVEQAREVEAAIARVKAEVESQREAALEALKAESASQHEAALAALRSEAAEQRDLAVAMARTEAAEHHEAALASVRAEAEYRHRSAFEALRNDLALEHAAALDAVRAQLVSGREAELEALRDELTAQHAAALEASRAEAAEQRDLAVTMARSEAAERHAAALEAFKADALGQQEAALSALRAEAERRQENALAGLGTELAAQHESALEALRRGLESSHEEAMTSLRAQLAAEHDAAIAAALAASLAESSRQHEAALAAIRADADDRIAKARAEADDLLAHARTEADERLTVAKAEAEASLAESVAAAKAEAVQVSDLVGVRATERQAELAFAERLSDAVRRLDAARSLTEVLDVLVDTSAREVPRVAVFLVKGNKLAGWRAAGFSRTDDPRELEVPLDQAGLLTKAVRSSGGAATSDATSGDGGATPFGSLPASSAAMAIPLRVGGETVGVLYADDVSPRERETPNVWPESVDVLVRHACRCLEVVTIARVTQPVSIPAPAPRTPRRLTPQARNFQAGHDDDDDAARRYARLLVSEIKLYHESAVTAGRRDRNLLERLRTEIDRARRLYGERVPAAVQARTDYFDQELVRTLANGDASLLGPA
jgi:hypothetical protein